MNIESRAQESELREQAFRAEMSKLGYAQSELLMARVQKAFFPAFIPVLSMLSLLAVFLAPFGLIETEELKVVALAAAFGAAWLLVVAPLICSRLILPLLGLERRYMGRFRSRGRGLPYRWAYIDHSRKSFTIWRHYRFEVSNLLK